jgi:putative heme-binding domain-containing protein
LSSSYSQLAIIATELLSGDTEPIRPLVSELARLIGSNSNPAESVQLLESVVRETLPDTTRIPVLLALDEGLRRRGTTILKVASDGGANASVHGSLSKLFQRASQVSLDASKNEGDRLAAIKLLALADSALAQKTLPMLFAPQTAPDLQLAAVKSLTSHETIEAFGLVLEPWKGFGPATRREIVDNLVQSVRGATALIRAIESGAVKPGEIERDKRQLLLNHPQTSVSQAAKVVLAEPPSNRKQVVANFQPALELTGDAERGRMLFSKTCLQCHRAGAAGHQVGPDFVSVQNKSPADLLVAILDPNREAQPNFQTYTAVTKQGKIYTGIISAETAGSLTLKRAEAKDDVILRDTIDELVSNGVSLMPEGLEKDLNQQQMADIIAAIKSVTP